jgi:hypothetical protein
MEEVLGSSRQVILAQQTIFIWPGSAHPIKFLGLSHFGSALGLSSEQLLNEL